MLSVRKKIFTGLFVLFLFAAGALVLLQSFEWIYFLSALCACQMALIYFGTRPIQRALDALLPTSLRGNEYSRITAAFDLLNDRIRQERELSILKERETEEILATLHEGIIAVNTSAKITFYNQSAGKMLQIGQPFDWDQSRLSKKCYELLLFSLQTSEVKEEVWSEKEDLYLYISSRPLHGGALLVLRDKTSDYKMLEVGKDFIANASHELRTPITIIRGYAETLQEISALSPTMLRQFAGKIVFTCERLDKLVRSLLTLADIEQHSQEKLKPTDLTALCENCGHFFLSAHPEARLTIHNPHEAFSILADTSLLEQAILNVLENAAKYSPSPMHIEMSVEKKENRALVHIKDFGIGIPKEELNKIFSRFYTVDKAHSRKLGGAGLGLSIVKTIMDKHGGLIDAESEVGKGSTFTLSLLCPNET